MKTSVNRRDSKTGQFVKGPPKPSRRNEGPSSQVRINGKVFLYENKAPFSKSGMSIRGALEIDPNTDTVRCHECGEYYETLGLHTRKHGLSAREYKLKHGLNLKSALIGERLREARIQCGLSNAARLRRIGAQGRTASSKNRAGTVWLKRNHSTPEAQNDRGMCSEQCLHKLIAIAKQVGRSPTFRELRQVGISESTLVFHFGSSAAAYRLAGLAMNKQSHMVTGIYTDDQLIGFIVNFIISFGRRPYPSDHRRGILPPRTTYIRRFGGFVNAVKIARRKIKKAGMVPVDVAGVIFRTRKCSPETRYKIKAARNKCRACGSAELRMLGRWKKCCVGCGETWRTNAGLPNAVRL